MRAWIRRLIDSARPFNGPTRATFLAGAGLDSGPVVFTATRERFRISVVRGRPRDVCECCAAPCHWLTLEFRSDDDVWEPLLLVHENNIVAIRQVVADVAKHLNVPEDDSRDDANAGQR